MDNNQKKWKVTTDRFVAFIDILGFKDRVLRSDHKEIYKMLRLLTKVLNESINISYAVRNMKKMMEYQLDPDLLDYTMFSDSIIIFTKNADYFTYQILCEKLNELILEAFKLNIPIKGSISFGTITVDKSNNIFFGQPLIDAYLLEEDLNYMGIVIHHNFEKYLLHINRRINISVTHVDYILPEIKTPFKTGNFTHRNLSFVNSPEYSDELINVFKLSSSGYTRKYIDNTKAVVEQLKAKFEVNEQKRIEELNKLNEEVRHRREM